MQLSLKGKTVILIISAIAMISIVALLCFGKGTRDIIYNQYSEQCTDLANTVARSVDIDDVRELRNSVLDIYLSIDPQLRMDVDKETEPGYAGYLANYDRIQDTDAFISLRRQLRRIQDVNHVECLYITFPDMEDGYLIYLVDGAYADVWRPGTLEPLYDSDFRDAGNIESGFGTLVSDTEKYGTIITTAMPIRDSYGQIIAYAGLDYSVNEIIHLQHQFVGVVALFITLLAILFSYIAIRFVDRFIVKPINELSAASVSFYDDENGLKHSSFADLDIHTGDEIEALARSMTQMEQDIEEHIANLLSTTNELNSTRERVDAMGRIAYVDSLTGVRNKRAYENELEVLQDEIDAGTAEFGILVADLNGLKLINDTYGHECGDESIRTICSLICNIFDHSPVFRFGGDEFVIILKKNDLENVDSLLEQMREAEDRLCEDPSAEPWQRVRAAFGFAVYDQEKDEDAYSVFRHADHAMYEDKKKIKGE